MCSKSSEQGMVYSSSVFSEFTDLSSFRTVYSVSCARASAHHIPLHPIAGMVPEVGAIDAVYVLAP